MVLNMNRLVPFLGGLVVGVAIGMLVLSGAVAGYPLVLTIGVSVLMFVGGLLLGRKSSPKPQPMRLTGRVFDFPQGFVMVEAALRRAKSIIPAKVTEE